MKKQRLSRLISAMLCVLMVLALAQSALAAVKPADQHTRLKAQYDAVLAKLTPLAEEDATPWLDVLASAIEESTIALESFTQAEGLQQSKKNGSPASDVFYQDALRDADRFGFFRNLYDRNEARVKGGYNLRAGRFYVDYYINPFTDAKIDYERYYKNWDITKYDRKIGALDVAAGEVFYFIQYAICKDDVLAPKGASTFDVYRIMLGNETLYMVKTTMTEAQLQKNRVKSPYISQAAFTFPSANEALTFDGTQVAFG